MSNTTKAASAATGGFPLSTICLIFWAIVRYAVPVGTTWGGMSAHVAAYVALMLGVVAPIAICLVLLAVVLLVVAVAAI